MEIEQLKKICRETCEELREISKEIETRSAQECEHDVMTMLYGAAKQFLTERRQHRDELRLKCEAMVEDIRKKLALIGFPGRIPVNLGELRVEPPYVPLLERLAQELDSLNAKVSELSQVRNRLWSEICILSDRMSTETPKLPDSLAESDLDEYRSMANTLQREYEQRLSRANALISKISEMSKFLGDQSTRDFCTPCDEKSVLNKEFLAFLEEQHKEIAIVYEERSNLVRRIEDRICAMANALETPIELPPTVNGKGSPERLKLLKALEKELDAAKLEKIDIFIQNSKLRTEQLWDQLFLDFRLRKSFEGRAPCEELLKEVEHEVSVLEDMLNEPDRKPLLAALIKLRQIRSNEKTLDEMSHDPGRLARRGFAASLKQEEKLRRYNERSKPEVLATLAKLSKSWAAEHNGETFCIDGVDLSTLLAEEAAKMPTNKRRHSQESKGTATAANSSQAKRLKPAPLRNSPRSANAPPPTTVGRAVTSQAHSNNVISLQRCAHTPHSALRGSNRPINRAKSALDPRSGRGQTSAPTRPSSLSALRMPHLQKNARANHSESRNVLAKPSSKPSIEVASLPLAIAASSSRSVSAQSRPKDLHLLARAHARPVSASARGEKENLVKPPSWEHDEFRKMQNLEMSYFDETQDHEIPSILKSFDYDRDAF